MELCTAGDRVDYLGYAILIPVVEFQTRETSIIALRTMADKLWVMSHL